MFFFFFLVTQRKLNKLARKVITVTFLVKKRWVLRLVYIMASVNLPNVVNLAEYRSQVSTD